MSMWRAVLLLSIVAKVLTLETKLYKILYSFTKDRSDEQSCKNATEEKASDCFNAINGNVCLW
jgi:hypothetical protein